VLNKQQFSLLTGLGAVALLLAITTIVLFNGNRSAQNEFNTRAQYIQQSLQLEPVYQGLIRSLADLSAKQNDAQLRDLLAAQGITFTAKQP
jgi:type VI protein secretion system component VasK